MTVKEIVEQWKKDSKVSDNVPIPKGIFFVEAMAEDAKNLKKLFEKCGISKDDYYIEKLTCQTMDYCINFRVPVSIKFM